MMSEITCAPDESKNLLLSFSILSMCSFFPLKGEDPAFSLCYQFQSLGKGKETDRWI